MDAYKSVVMKTMAAAFGVGEPFLDKELSRFIAAGRLNAKIDKARGPVRLWVCDSDVVVVVWAWCLPVRSGSVSGWCVT